jgi:anti-sigma B factor antagonist
MSELATVTATDLGGARLVSVSGEVDLSNVGTVMAAISAAIPSDVSLVIVDLSETEYLDSTGLAMLFGFARQLGYTRQELCLVVPPDSPVRRVLELTNATRVIRVEDQIPGQ